VIARRANVPFRCHDLRHAFASRFLQATGNIPALQAILGHRSIQMTMRYAHMITGHLHQAMTGLGGFDGIGGFNGAAIFRFAAAALSCAAFTVNR
jgi:Phage integrase family